MEQEQKKISEARKRATAKYLSEKVEEFKVRVPMGRKAEIQAHAKGRDMSTNAFICAAIDAQIERDLCGDTGIITAQEAAGSPRLSLPDEVMDVAQAAAQTAGETVEAFIARAIKTQADRDKITRIL